MNHMPYRMLLYKCIIFNADISLAGTNFCCVPKKTRPTVLLRHKQQQRFLLTFYWHLPLHWMETFSKTGLYLQITADILVNCKQVQLPQLTCCTVWMG